MLKDRQDLKKFREECVRSYNAYTRKILVCAGTGCVSSGSLNIYAKLRELIEANGIHCAVELEEEPENSGVALKKSGCHGFCERGPLVRIEPEGWLYTKVKVEDCEEIVEKTIVNGEHIEQQFDMTPNETDFGPFTVPEGHYFVMGDNRNNSKDSRSPMVGALERKMIKGHVRCVVFPLSKARILGE